MDYNKWINRWTYNIPQEFNEQLISITNTEKEYLYKLFECAENISAKLSSLKILEQTEQDLYKELEKTKEELYIQFYRKFCSRTILQDEIKPLIINDLWEENIDDIWDTLDDYQEIDTQIRTSFSKLIFEYINKKDIHWLLWNNSEETKKFLDLVPKCLDDFIGYLHNHIVYIFSEIPIEETIALIKWSPYLTEIEKEENWLKVFLQSEKGFLISQDVISRFLAYQKYKDNMEASINDYLSQQSNFNFDAMVYSIVIWIQKILNNVDLINEYIKFFVTKRNYFETFTEEQKEYIWSLYTNTKTLFTNSFKEYNDNNDNHENDIENIDFGAIMDSSKLDFAYLINQKIIKLLNRSEWEKYNSILRSATSDNAIYDYLEKLYKENKFNTKMFSIRKEYFLNKINKAILNTSLLTLTETEKAEILNDLSKKYPKARADAQTITEKKYWEIRKEFVAQKENEIKAKILSEISINLESLKELKFWQLLFISNLFVQFFTDSIKNNIRQGYIQHVINFVEQWFKKSTKKVEEKEIRDKAKKAQQRTQAQQAQIRKQQSEQEEKREEKPIELKEKELPEWLTTALEKYFGWTINPKIIKSLMKRPWTYKTWRFTRFKVDEKFYKILDEHWLICDDNTDWTNKWNTKSTWIANEPQGTNQKENSTSNTESDDKKILNDKLSFIKSQIEWKSNLDDETFNLYIELFKLMGYEIENENNIRYGLIEIRSNIVQLNSLLYKIINWWKIWRDNIWWWIKSNKFSENYKTAYILKFWGTLWKFIVGEKLGKKYVIAITRHWWRYDDKFSVD